MRELEAMKTRINKIHVHVYGEKRIPIMADFLMPETQHPIILLF